MISECHVDAQSIDEGVVRNRPVAWAHELHIRRDVQPRRGLEVVEQLHAGAVLGVVARHEADDAFPVVSAASILAKARREEAVARMREELGEDLGSGYPSDTRTTAFLEKWIREKGVLPPHTRASWKTAQRLMDKHGPGVRRLEEF